MRKILLSLLVIAMALGLVGAGASGAFFSDMETAQITANSGIIDITLNGENGVVVPLEILDLKPCDTGWAHLLVSNTGGGNEGPIYLHFDVEESLGHETGCPEPENAVGGCQVSDIANWIWVDLYINDACVIEDGVITLAELDCFWFPAGWLDVDGTMKIDISFHINADAGNQYQADGVTFDLEVEMRDHNAPPPENMILLENKTAASDWKPIDDDLWGIASYQVNSLDLFIWATGLTPNTDYQICLTSPEDATWYPLTQAERESMASALASGVYGTPPSGAPPAGYNTFERGYSSGGASLSGTYSAGNQGVFTTSKNGATPRTFTSNEQGILVGKVSFPLPSGAYEYIKVTVKEDFSPYTTILMEATTPLTFTIP